MALLPHQQRVIDEKASLDEKLEKLTTFVSGKDSIFCTLDADERVRLVRQHGFMTQYSTVLGERITAFSKGTG